MSSPSPSNSSTPSPSATAASSPYKGYEPSLAAAVVTIIVFCLLTITHVVRLVQTRKWFCVVALLGGCFEIIGFICRAAGSSNPFAKPPYIIQYLTILLAPIFFAATAYAFLGRLIRATKRQEHSIIRTSWMTKIFVSGDILCFLIQAGGGGILASANDANMEKIGNDIILAGLWLQIVIFAVYVATAIVFDVRMRRDQIANIECQYLSWKMYIYTLYGVSILITARNIYRAVEYTQGRNGYLMTTEWPVYVLDALPMAFVLALIVFWYSAQLSSEIDEKQPDMIKETQQAKGENREMV